MKYMPQEIEVWYVIPAIRRDLAKAMLEMGLKQKDIASKLGLTEPAVSQYLKSKRAKEVVFDEWFLGRIRIAAKRIAQDSDTMMKEVQAICDHVRKKGLLCRIAAKYHKTQEGCCVCMRR